MTTRILPVKEYSKVAHTGVEAWLEHAVPADTSIVVVEDGDRVVACWAVLRVTHLEGVWIDPAYRHRVSVVSRLLAATFQVARQFGTWAMTGAQTDDVRRLITKHLRGQRIDMDTYVVPLEPTCR